MERGSRRWWVVAAALVLIAVVALRWLLSDSGGAPREPPPERRAATVPTRVERERITAFGGSTPRPPSSAGAAPDTPPDEPPTDLQPGEMRGLGTVDLDEVRKAMPDNLYWKLSSPTNDPQVVEERSAERNRWNVEYGKVLSGTATEEEIRSYYDYRARLAGDYIEFASYLLDHYKDQLTDQDLTLVHLALRLNRARLEEIPRKIEEALERKRKQDAARAAWLADQETFGSNPQQ